MSHWTTVGDDVTISILSFLSLSELNTVLLVSKQFRLSQLSSHDLLWQNYYKVKISEYVAITTFGSQPSTYKEYEQVTYDYRKTLINLLTNLNTQAQRNDRQLLSDIENMDMNPFHTPFHTQELLNRQLSKIQTNCKVVLVGDEGVGEYSLHKVFSAVTQEKQAY